ncbi:MAG: ferritin [Lentisphaerae bacterium]|nr:ferritin [Lentisphaerota bacterium]OQC12991.1 MAG: Ferritin [Lentisphaerae bacterium ADurb.Bin082]HQL87744.1 ferritin [Lentisphaeria bacterium]
MINDKMAKALNEQMNKEFYNSRLYLSMATFFHDINMEGGAKWMEKQAAEETEHAMKLYNYLKDRGARILLTEVPAPPTSWASPLAAFEDAYKHECDVSKEIDDLVEMARTLKDNATLNFLQWFVDEQVEEEAITDAIVQKLKMASKGSGALFFMDRMLGER